MVGARLVPLKSRESAPNPWYEATVTEAKSDALRQNLSRLGHHVEKIRRVKVAELELGAIEPGQYRMLSESEVTGLLRTVGRATGKPAKAAATPMPYRGNISASPRRAPSRPSTGGAVRYGSARPGGPRQHSGKKWGRPTGNQPMSKSGGKGPRGPRRKFGAPTNHKRTHRG